MSARKSALVGAAAALLIVIWISVVALCTSPTHVPVMQLSRPVPLMTLPRAHLLPTAISEQELPRADSHQPQATTASMTLPGLVS